MASNTGSVRWLDTKPGRMRNRKSASFLGRRSTSFRARRLLRVEHLEDRRLLATLLTESFEDPDGEGVRYTSNTFVGPVNLNDFFVRHQFNGVGGAKPTPRAPGSNRQH